MREVNEFLGEIMALRFLSTFYVNKCDERGEKYFLSSLPIIVREGEKKLESHFECFRKSNFAPTSFQSEKVENVVFTPSNK